MKKIFTPLAILLSACAVKAPISYQQQCAMKGMVLKGLTSETSQSFAVGNNGSYASGSGASEAVSCEVPQTKEQGCEAKRQSDIAYPILRYNDSTKGGNALIGVGYLLWIAPGVVGKVAWDNKYDSAMQESRRIDETTKLSCQPSEKREAASEQSK